MDELEINIRCKTNGKKCDISIDYDGSCKPRSFDRSILSIITYMMELRTKELKRIGDVHMSYTDPPFNDDETEYTKR